MHGTWINGKKIPTEEDSVINHDDVVTFGSTVYRGSGEYCPTTEKGTDVLLTCHIRYLPSTKSSL